MSDVDSGPSQRGVVDAAREGKSKAREAKDWLKRHARETVEEHPELKKALAKLEEKQEEFTAKMKEIAEEKKQLLLDKTEGPRERLKEKIAAKAQVRMAKGLDRVRLFLIDLLVDPYMPKFVQNWVDGLVTTMWPDVEDEIYLAITKQTHDGDALIEEENPVGCGCCNPLLASLRYFLYPYDKSFWHQLHNPLFVFYKLCTLTPYFGVQQFIFGFQFFVIDRTDEYQLMEYILDFKRLLFFTAGLIGCAVAALQFYLCSQELSGQSEDPPCSITSPREKIWAMLGVLLQCMCVWVAFLDMGGSIRKGGQYVWQLKDEVTASAKKRWMVAFGKPGTSPEPPGEGENNQDGTDLNMTEEERRESESQASPRSRGASIMAPKFSPEERRKIVVRRMGYFLLYDIICVLICVGLVCWFVWGGPDEPIHEKGGYRFDVEVSSVTVTATEDHHDDHDHNHNHTSFGDDDGSHDNPGPGFRRERRQRVVNETYDEDWQEHLDHWRIETTLYMARVLYGLLSFPFFILSLPLFETIVTHSKRTGYTRRGQCVPYIGEKKKSNVVEVSPASEGGGNAGNGERWADSRPPPRD
eukprot:TRINITY_DN2997_c0_g1_i1.p1 TRINITY_DN2997_c0_g1~~TRINITY_DN2997_c0_g1_i1.p1  ORF type:complete len:583 (+),score=220.98 TRINITY_DN2997_c0_g1_i1:92-1840(+)